ncbi:cation:dicarboxylase symporter family transporter [Methylomarinum sp. Ch1-1]|uniref:Cation:dicarboxylase symporter family transporter n=1 Tax=Methylomarinum roseum TaxID=3067653 RepID=A0AAU7P0W5_9GAMM|nr:cation:dicarboxylase symporter family transporter [Methylomarinum sp. Ch1-1]MDP4521350.1 cation:dicarboxylase symporter family transporter [Methylomarinum sp. Ch1-1]
MSPSTDLSVSKHKPQRFAFTWWIVGSLFLGIFVGLFFGGDAEKLQVLGDIYIGLLQMTVLPFVMFALIANIGLLNYFEARLLARHGLLILMTLWLIGICSVWAFSLALPTMESGAFFSSLLTQAPAKLQFIDLFIPANPFMALSQNAVPAVVLFSMLFGIACIGFPERKSLLEHCNQAAKVLLRVNGFVVKLTPIGVFGIAASAAGTLTLEEFGRVQAYVLMLLLAVLIVTLIILPLLIMSCTPFTYRQIFRASRDALLTAFVVGSIFAIIPLLTQGVSRLFHAHVTAGEEHVRIPDLVLPLAYPFPDIGRLLSLVFIVFAAWFYGKPLDFLQYPEMLTIGLFLSFGKLITAIPFLLDIYHIPDDIFNLFLTVGIICRRFADVAGAMHLLTFTIVTTAIMTGHFKIRWRLVLWTIMITLLSFMISITALRLHLTHSVTDLYSKDQEILQMQLLYSGVNAKVLDYSRPNPAPLTEGQKMLDRIQQRGLIRIGILEDNLPFSYYNHNWQLVGFDVELMHHLAKDLGVGIEFVPYESEYLMQELENDHFDIAVSSITANPRLLASRRVLYSISYLNTNFAFVVPDHQRTEFADAENVRALENIRVGVRKDSVFADRIKYYFPNLQVDELDSESDFFAIESFRQQALVTSAEGGSAWTLLNPGYEAVNPLPGKAGAPLVIAIGGEDLQLEKYLSTWITLKRQDGTIKQLFEHWIQGKTPHPGKQRRWSILHDVLQQSD